MTDKRKKIRFKNTPKTAKPINVNFRNSHKEIDPMVAERIEDRSAPKLKSNWMWSLPVIAKPKTWVYAILTIEGNDKLGKVLWKNRTYIFIPDNDPNFEIEFYQSCLRAIADFCQALMQERAALKQGPKLWTPEYVHKESRSEET